MHSHRTSQSNLFVSSPPFCIIVVFILPYVPRCRTALSPFFQVVFCCFFLKHYVGVANGTGSFPYFFIHSLFAVPRFALRLPTSFLPPLSLDPKQPTTIHVLTSLPVLYSIPLSSCTHPHVRYRSASHILLALPTLLGCCISHLCISSQTPLSFSHAIYSNFFLHDR